MGIPLDELQIDIVVNSENAASGIKTLATNLRDLGSAGKTASSGLTKTAQDIQSLGTATAESATTAKETGKALNTVSKEAEKTSQSVKKAGKEAQKSAGKFSNFVHSIGRIAMYRLIRSGIRLVTQAITEGFNAFVAWDREHNNSMAGAAAAVDKVKASWNQLKGAIGALGGALAASFAPIITFIVDGLTKMADLLQMVIRSLQGEYTYYHLIYKEAKATTGAAKELKRVLFGFDELNILPSKNGGGMSSDSGSWLYEEIPIESKFLNGIADISEGLQGLFGYSEDTQKSLGGLAGIFGVLIGGKAIGGLLRLLPGLIGGFNRKTEALGRQTTATQAETSAVKALVPAFALALGAAMGFGGYLKKNPMIVTTKVNAITPSLSSAFNSAKAWLSDRVLTVRTSVQEMASKVKSAYNDAKSWLQDKVLTISTGLSNNFNSLVGTLASWIQSLQGYASQHPIILPVFEQKQGSSSPAVPSGSMSANPNTQGGYLTHGKSSSYQYTGASAVSVGSGVVNKNGTSYYYAKHEYDPLGITNPTGLDPALYRQFKAARDRIYESAFGLESTLAAYYNSPSSENAQKALNMMNGSYSALNNALSGIPMNPNYKNASGTAFTTFFLNDLVRALFVGAYASGGLIPNTGSLFVAGEAGAEVVANMGSHTGVMNVDQMQQAVANGNIDVVNAIYAMSNMVVNAVNNKNFDIYMDSAKVGKSVTAYQNNQARRGLVQGAM